MLDYRIETFLTLCETLSYTKTAKILNITQPAVTQHIKYLEQYYNTMLFSYENKHLRLSEKGVELHKYMIAMRGNSKKIFASINEKKQEDKEILLGASKSISDFLLPKAISKYMRNNSSNLVNLVSKNTDELLDDLNQGKIDIAMVEGTFEKDNYDCQVLRDEPFICVASPTLVHQLPSSLEELFAYRLIVREYGSGTRSILEQYLKNFSYSIECFKSRVEIDHLFTIKEMVLAGIGISFLYQMVAEEELRNGSLIRIPFLGDQIYRPLHFVCTKENLFKEKCDSFIDEFQKYI